MSDAQKQQFKLPAGQVVILFKGEKCPPCEVLEPMLSREMAKRPFCGYVVLKPTPEMLPIYRQYGVRSTPTVIHVNDRHVEVGRFTGLRSEEVLKECLNRWNVS